MKLEDLNYSEQELRQMAKSLNDNCARVDSHNYNKFLKQTKIGEATLIDIILDLHELPLTGQHKKERALGLTKEKQYELVKEFFSKLDESLGDLICSILDGKNKKYKLKLINKKGSAVGHSDENDWIDIYVYLIDTVKNLVELPHELAHATTGYNTEILKLVDKLGVAKNSKDKKAIEQARSEFKRFTAGLGEFDKDCIGEIESHIVERLFYRFLLNKNIITDEDYQNFRIGAMNSFDCNLNQVLEEFDIIENLTCPISYESAIGYVQSLLNKNDDNAKNLLRRLKEMSNPDKDSTPVRAEYDMRYIVGEIISSEWFDSCEQADKKQREIMKKRFVEYLSKTSELKVEDACLFLLDKPLDKVIESFIKKKKALAQKNVGC